MTTAVLPVTGDPEADELLVTDPFALLVGMLLDQQVPMEWAFRGPATLRDAARHARRRGHRGDESRRSRGRVPAEARAAPLPGFDGEAHATRSRRTSSRTTAATPPRSGRGVTTRRCCSTASAHSPASARRRRRSSSRSSASDSVSRRRDGRSTPARSATRTRARSPTSTHPKRSCACARGSRSRRRRARAKSRVSRVAQPISCRRCARIARAVVGIGRVRPRRVDPGGELRNLPRRRARLDHVLGERPSLVVGHALARDHPC